MNPVKTHAHPPDELIDYLNSHPDFFIEHPELLAELNIPHIPGRKVPSLIEYQVARLRQELDELRNSITRMEYDAVNNSRLTGEMHTLSLEVLEARTPLDLYNILCRDLKTFYSADHVLLLIFASAGTMTDHAGLKFLDPNSSLRFMFSELFHRGKPLCGSLQEEHLQALFGANSEAIKSTVLLPFACDGWQALLVLGSLAENLYSHGLELDLLDFLNNILNSVIRNSVK